MTHWRQWFSFRRRPGWIVAFGMLIGVGIAHSQNPRVDPVTSKKGHQEQKPLCRDLWFQNQNNHVKAQSKWIYDSRRFQRQAFHDLNKAVTESKTSYEQYWKELNATVTHPSYSDRSDCRKEWTVLVVMDAEDSEMLPYALWDLYEMESAFFTERKKSIEEEDVAPSFVKTAGSTLKKDILVQYNPVGSTGARRVHVFQSENPYNPQLKPEHFHDLARNAPDHYQSPIVQVVPEVGTSKEKLFTDFVQWGVENYPSDHVVVIYWGHGKGWIEKDPDSKIHLSAPEIKSALHFIHHTVLKRPIDHLIFDACFMNSIELMTEISQNARFISGSAQIQNFLGLPYRRFFYQLEKDFEVLKNRPRQKQEVSSPLSGPEKSALALPELVRASFNDKGNGFQKRIDPNGFQNLTFASVDSQQLNSLFVPAFMDFARQLQAFLATEPLEEGTPNRAAQLESELMKVSLFYAGFPVRELGSFIEVVRGFAKERGDPNLERAAERAHEALRASIPHHVLGSRYQNKPGFLSTSVWIPLDKADFQANRNNFTESFLFNANEKAWFRALSALFPTGSR